MMLVRDASVSRVGCWWPGLQLDRLRVSESLILAMAIVRRAKYTHARAREILRQRALPSRRVASKFRARACVYFARPTIAIAKIRDYSQSTVR